MMLQGMLRILSGAALAGLAIVHPASAQAGSDDPVWSFTPRRVDKQQQSLERLPAKEAAEMGGFSFAKYPLELKRTLPFRVIDSASFVYDGKKYRITDVAAVPVTKICFKASGQRWACGLKSRVALSGRLRGKQVRCAPSGEEGGFIRVSCVGNGKDVGGFLVEAGFALALGGRYQAQQDAAKQAGAGVWDDRPTANN